ncbi:MAG: 6-phosphogluconolactonase [Pedobacter sp.]
MSVLIYNNSAKLFHDLSEYILKIASHSIAEKGSFNFVLTGGNSPKTLYEILASTYKDKLDWSKVFFFFGDERNVLPNHESYNGLMAKRSILEPLQIAEDHIFYVNTALEPEQAAAEYNDSIVKHFGGDEINFDLILLGMGDDAHTASLFPETSILDTHEAIVSSVYVEKLSTYRITFTAALINKAKNIAFLVFGDSKAQAIQHVLGDTDKDTTKYPSQLIAPVNGTLTWFLDDQAAALLENQ